jgi:hypothetical protein
VESKGKRNWATPGTGSKWKVFQCNTQNVDCGTYTQCVLQPRWVNNRCQGSRIRNRPRTTDFWGWWTFKGDKNPYHDCLRRERKAVAPCRKILQHVKDPWGVWRR